MTGHQIKGWDDHFESYKSRSVDHCSHAYVPNKMGMGYNYIMHEPDGPAIYGAFMAAVLVVSRQSKQVRQGYLTDTGRVDGAPYTTTDLSLMTKIPKAVFERMFQVTTGTKVDWIRTYDAGGTVGVPQGYREDTPESPNVTQRNVTQEDITKHKKPDLGFLDSPKSRVAMGGKKGRRRLAYEMAAIGIDLHNSYKALFVAHDKLETIDDVPHYIWKVATNRNYPFSEEANEDCRAAFGGRA
jgi:hypothetical protein